MMQIKKLTLTHKKDLRVILEDFQLVLNDGDKAVIIGEEGNGKSTLLKWMYDPALTEDYIESTGERIIGKERLGYLPQELPEAEKTKTVYEYFYEKEKFWDQTEGSGGAGKKIWSDGRVFLSGSADEGAFRRREGESADDASSHGGCHGPSAGRAVK